MRFETIEINLVVEPIYLQELMREVAMMMMRMDMIMDIMMDIILLVENGGMMETS